MIGVRRIKNGIRVYMGRDLQRLKKVGKGEYKYICKISISKESGKPCIVDLFHPAEK